LNNGDIFQADFPGKRVRIYGNSRNMEEKRGGGAAKTWEYGSISRQAPNGTILPALRLLPFKI
jgi:hypothetical protein